MDHREILSPNQFIGMEGEWMNEWNSLKLFLNNLNVIDNID